MTAAEAREVRLRRLHMRSMRRGIKEMDIILSRYAARRLPDLTDAELDAYESLLSENDQDLYTWVSGQIAPPSVHVQTVTDIARTSTAPRGEVPRL